MKGSWRSTLLGILGGVSILVTQIVAVLDDNPETKFSTDAALAALAMFGIGLVARDKNVSSEEQKG